MTLKVEGIRSTSRSQKLNTSASTKERKRFFTRNRTFKGLFIEFIHQKMFYNYGSETQWKQFDQSKELCHVGMLCLCNLFRKYKTVPDKMIYFGVGGTFERCANNSKINRKTPSTWSCNDNETTLTKS